MSALQPKIYADFHNADSQGRLRLDCVGTKDDLAEQNVELREGLSLTLYADDANDQGELDELLVHGVVTYSPEERCWVAHIDWSAIRHASDFQKHLAAETTQTASKPAVTAG